MAMEAVTFKLGETGLKKMKNENRPGDGLLLITHFAQHPGYRGLVRYDDGLGYAIFQPTDSDMAALMERMLVEMSTST